MRKLWQERETAARQTVEAGGAQITKIENKEEWSKAMQPVYARYANTPELKSLTERIQSAQ
jgi:TRAP-type C4-dicarboxylate transport system substrate-binding protein